MPLIKLFFIHRGLVAVGADPAMAPFIRQLPPRASYVNSKVRCNLLVQRDLQSSAMLIAKYKVSSPL